MTYGTCQYCGQLVTLSHEYEDETVANRAASQICRCPEAAQERLSTEAAQDADEKIDSLFGSGAGKRGTDPIYDEEALLLLKDAARLVAVGSIGKATFKVDDYTVNITITSKGRMKITRKETKTYTEE